MLSIVDIVKYVVAFFFLYATVFFLLLAIQNRHAFTRPVPDTRFRPRITVIIPAYNEEKHIGRCLRSLLDVHYPQDKLEIIVMDDGSTDGTYALARSIAKKNRIVKVYTQPNAGKAATLNAGIAHARGEIIATLDADSYVSRDAILKMLPLFDSEDVAAVTAAVHVRPKRNEGFLRTMQKLEYLFIVFSRKILTFIDAVPVTPGPLSMFRAWVFERLGPFDEKNIMEDQEMALRIQAADYRIRSSMDANVYTEVPENFGALLNQRVRWHRGGLRNNLKYLRLMSPSYGDFGVMMMPMTFIALFSMLALFVITGGYYFSTSFYYSTSLGLESLLLGIEPLHIMGIFVMLFNIAWVLWGLWIFKNEKVNPFKLVLYLFVYLYLITLYWFVAILRELRAQRLSWDG